MKKNDIDIDDDMSKTFIAEVGQKSAIADEEVLEENTNESNFPDISIEPPEEEIETTTNKEEDYTEEIFYDTEIENKKNNPVIVIILMIFSLLIGVVGSYYYFEIYNKKESIKDEKITTSKSNDINEKELNTDGLFIKNLIEDYKLHRFNEVEVFKVMYANNKTNVSDIDDFYLRTLAAVKAKKNLGDTGFSGKSFTNAVKTLFGSEIILENKSFTDNQTDEGLCYAYEYDQKEDYYFSKEPIGCGGGSTISLKQKIVKAIKKEDSLEVAVAVALVDTDTDKVYKQIDATTEYVKLIDEVEDTTALTFNIDKDYSKLNQYKYTFNYDEENNNYYLESIELIK